MRWKSPSRWAPPRVPQGPASPPERRYRRLGQLGTGTWLRAGAFGALTALAIAIPSRLVPNTFFSRMTPTRPLDYVFLLASSALLGLILALRSAGAGAVGTGATAGGLGTFLAVGCPVCNKLVVALLGTGGALSFFAPLQPFIGLAAMGVLGLGLRRQLTALGASACVPADS